MLSLRCSVVGPDKELVEPTRALTDWVVGIVLTVCEGAVF